MRLLAFAPVGNSDGKHDADWFRTCARKLLTVHGSPVALVTFDAHADRFAKMHVIEDALTAAGKLDAVAFFCHGWATGIQAGYNIFNLRRLARAISAACGAAPVVPLYCCSTAMGPVGGDGHFADKLRDALCVVGAIQCTVTGHSTAGDCAGNPYLRAYCGDGSQTDGRGGSYLVDPASDLWDDWRRAIAETDIEYRAPWMTADQIAAELRARV